MNDLFKEFVKIEAPQSEVSSFALMGVVETRSRGGGGDGNTTSMETSFLPLGFGFGRLRNLRAAMGDCRDQGEVCARAPWPPNRSAANGVRRGTNPRPNSRLPPHPRGARGLEGS